MAIPDHEHVLRRVTFLWVREDGSILEDAYRPIFPRDDEGVSIGIKSRINSKTKLLSFNRGGKKNRTCVCQLSATVPKSHGYAFAYKPDSLSHGLIVGDMKKLAEHTEALLDFSSKSEIIFNHPYEDWLMKPTTP